MDNIHPVGFVYIIHSPNTDMVYIGSTLKNINDRFALHKKLYETNRNRTRATRIFNAVGDMTYITCNELESLVNITKEQLRMREQYWIDCHPTAVNGSRAIKKTKVEILKSDPVNYPQYLFAQYGENDLTTMLPASMKPEYVRAYYAANAEKIKDQHKKYYTANKEKFAAKYQQNKDEVKAKQNAKYAANKINYKLVREQTRSHCGVCNVSVQNLAAHKIGIRHQKNETRLVLSPIAAKDQSETGQM